VLVILVVFPVVPVEVGVTEIGEIDIGCTVTFEVTLVGSTAMGWTEIGWVEIGCTPVVDEVVDVVVVELEVF